MAAQPNRKWLIEYAVAAAAAVAVAYAPKMERLPPRAFQSLRGQLLKILSRRWRRLTSAGSRRGGGGRLGRARNSRARARVTGAGARAAKVRAKDIKRAPKLLARARATQLKLTAAERVA